MERRLAAILAADVVGYSRFVGADEEGALRTAPIVKSSTGWLALDLTRTPDSRHRTRKLLGDPAIHWRP